MSCFTTALRVEELADGRRRLLYPLAFFSSQHRGVFVVPAGFVTNYASSPRVSWSIFPDDGPWKWAATLHDGAYRAALQTEHGGSVHLTKPLADNLFREAMACPPCRDQVKAWKRYVMYLGVVQFGGRAYGGLGVSLEGS